MPEWWSKVPRCAGVRWMIAKETIYPKGSIVKSKQSAYFITKIFSILYTWSIVTFWDDTSVLYPWTVALSGGKEAVKIMKKLAKEQGYVTMEGGLG